VLFGTVDREVEIVNHAGCKLWVRDGQDLFIVYLYDSLAELAGSLKAGVHVFIEGHLRVRKFVKSRGQHRSDFLVINGKRLDVLTSADINFEIQTRGE
jgi:single-stranded DNA-binding protein